MMLQIEPVNQLYVIAQITLFVIMKCEQREQPLLWSPHTEFECMMLQIVAYQSYTSYT
jgi:hypothetical protein